VLYTLVVLLGLSPLLADLFGHRFTDAGARLGHGLYLGLDGACGWLSGLLSSAGGEIRGWLVVFGTIATAVALTAWARALDPEPGTAPTARQRIAAGPWQLAVGLPALLGVLLAVLLTAALEPRAFVSLWLVAVAGAALGRRRRRPPLPWERSLTGLPAASWASDHLLRFALLLLALSALVGGGLLGGVEGAADAALRSLEQQFGGKPGNLVFLVAAGILIATLLADPTRRALAIMTWEPWLAAAVGALLVSFALSEPLSAVGSLPAAALGAAVGLAGTTLGGAGAAAVPLLSLHPLRAAGRLTLPLLAAAASTTWAIATGPIGCDAVRADPRIEVLLSHPGAGSLAPSEGVHPALFVAFPKEGLVTRLSFKDGADRGVDVNNLPDEMREPPLGEPRLRPGRLALSGIDEVLLLANAEQQEFDNGVVVAIDSLTSLPLATAISMDSCQPGSSAWHPFHSLTLIGCEDRGEIALFEPTMHRFIAQQAIPSVPAVRSLLVDPRDGSLVLLPRLGGPFLVRYDLASARTLSWRFVGAGNHHLSQDIDGVLYLPRFTSRQVLVLEGEELNPSRSLAAGLGLNVSAPVLASDILLAASSLTGTLYALDRTGAQEPRELHLGGLLRDLRVAPGGNRAFAAGMCGVLAIDLAEWLDDDEL